MGPFDSISSLLSHQQSWTLQQTPTKQRNGLSISRHLSKNRIMFQMWHSTFSEGISSSLAWVIFIQFYSSMHAILSKIPKQSLQLNCYSAIADAQQREKDHIGRHSSLATLKLGQKFLYKMIHIQSWIFTD